MNLKSEPLISDYNLFVKTCNKINTSKKWNAFIVPLPLDTTEQDKQTLNILDPADVYSKIKVQSIMTPEGLTIENKYICDDNQERFEELLNLKDTTIKKITYLYPITLQDGKFAKPAKLYVIVSEEQKEA